MRLKTILATAAMVAVMGTAPAMAELVFPALSYRTGPYAPNGIPFADGYADYLTLVNERDGGVEGEKIRMIECETGYNTEKGVECYESTKGEGALIYQPLSTGITYQLIPKATADKIPGAPRQPMARSSPTSSTIRRPTGMVPRSSSTTSLRRTAATSTARRSRSSTTIRPTERNRFVRWRNSARSTATPCRSTRSTIRARSRRRPGCRSAATVPTTR